MKGCSHEAPAVSVKRCQALKKADPTETSNADRRIRWRHEDTERSYLGGRQADALNVAKLWKDTGVLISSRHVKHAQTRTQMQHLNSCILEKARSRNGGNHKPRNFESKHLDRGTHSCDRLPQRLQLLQPTEANTSTSSEQIEYTEFLKGRPSNTSRRLERALKAGRPATH